MKKYAAGKATDLPNLVQVTAQSLQRVVIVSPLEPDQSVLRVRSIEH